MLRNWFQSWLSVSGKWVWKSWFDNWLGWTKTYFRQGIQDFMNHSQLAELAQWSSGFIGFSGGALWSVNYQSVLQGFIKRVTLWLLLFEKLEAWQRFNTGVGGSSWQATLNGHSWHLSVSFRKGFVNKIYEHMHHWCPQDMTIKRIPITSFGSYGRTCVRSMKTENNLLRASVCSFKMFLSRHHTLGL